MVIPIGAVVTAATGVKKRSRGQGLFLVSVKWSRTIFKFGNNGQDINVLRMCIVHSVVKCVRSNGQGPICGAVKRSRSRLRCGQAVKQQKQWSKFFDPGRSRDYSAYRSDHPLYIHGVGS